MCVPERDREKVTAREAVRDRERGGGIKSEQSRRKRGR